MSIYCTLGQNLYEVDSTVKQGEDWYHLYADVCFQGVPAHIDYIGEAWSWLPPPIDPESDEMRAVVVIGPGTTKGSERCGQEYVNPLFIVSGAEYKKMTANEMHTRIYEALQRPEHSDINLLVRRKNFEMEVGPVEAIAEHDVVYVRYNIESEGHKLRTGIRGTVVSVCDNGKAFAVEFPDLGSAIVVTLRRDLIGKDRRNSK